MIKAIAITALSLIATSGYAQSIRVGPYLQDATPTSIWIGWETTSGTESTVLYGTAPGRLTGSASGGSIASQGSARIHHTQITGLNPDTVYYYRVQTDGATSDVIRFRTPAEASAEQPFRFVAYSDTQGGPIPDMHTQVINEGVIDFVTGEFGPEMSDELDFAIEPGDLVDAGSNYGQWKTQYFDEEQNLIQHIPIYPVPGNHEQDSHWFFDYFKLPENGTPGFEEHWWYKDHGNIRIVGLDSNGNYRVQAQLDWLDGVLADAATNDRIDFVFAQLHHPHLSGIWTPGNTLYTGEVVERLERFSTDTGKPSIHFFGHTHAYERGQSKDHTHLWVNVAAGEGGIDFWDQSDIDYPEYQRVFPEWGFVLMEVEAGDNPKFRLRRVSRGNAIEPKDNEVVDDITIKRFNLAPSVPSPMFPEAGTVGIDPLAAELRGSAFSDADGDFHAESEYQLTTVAGDYSDAVSHWVRFENWYAPEGATGSGNGYYSVNTVEDPDVSRTVVTDLDALTTYHWRVRYRDSALGWSEWSAESSFTTGTPPLGACCLPTGGCEQLAERDCDAARGEWLGPDADCDDCPASDIVVLFEEDFDSVALGPNTDEATPDDTAWTDTPPAGWTVDDSGVPNGGVAEWRGWSFTDPEWWAATASDQGRSMFTKGTGAIAVADPDEWDDAANDAGEYNAAMESPPIALDNIATNSVRVLIDSSWRPEPNQRAEIRAIFDNGAEVVVLDYRSEESSENYQPDAINESLWIDVPNPGDAGSMTLRFSLLDAGNNWWWAIDNILVVGEPQGQTRIFFEEDFDALNLGPNSDETIANSDAWTDTPPPGWSIRNISMPGVGDPTQGVEEWEGWSFTDPVWWTEIAADQRRSEFTKGTGVIAVADPDEWDDLGDPESLGFYETTLTTPEIGLAAIKPGTMTLRFDSSWRPEDTQRVSVVAEFADGTEATLLEWDSRPGPNFKGDATNETIEIPVPSAGDGTVRFRFGMFEAANDWWWAIDNIFLTAICLPDLAPEYGVIDLADISAFVAAFVGQQTTADINSDGTYDLADITQFVSAFIAGCP